jgi:hypothetical protein
MRFDDERPTDPEAAAQNIVDLTNAVETILRVQPKYGQPKEDPLSKFGLEAIDLRWTLKDIIARRWLLTPINPQHLATLIELGLVEMRDDEPCVTSAGQDVTRLP